MKKRNTIIFIIAGLLLIIALFLIFNNSTGTFKRNVKDFAVKDTATITKVFLADKNNNSILLEKQAPGKWILNKTYKVRNSGVRLLFETFKNLIAKYPVSKKAHNNVIAQLAARSTKVEIYQEVYRINLFDRIKLFPHEKLTKTYYVGGPTPDNMGTLMLMEGADVAFVVHLLGFRGFVGPRYSTIEKDWRDHIIFKTKLSEIRTIIMEMPGEPENSFKIDSRNRELTLTKLQTNEVVDSYDTLKLLNFISSFADLRYEALLNDLDPTRKDSIINSTPKNIVTVVDTNGDSTTMISYFKPNDNRQFDVVGKLYVYDLDRLYALINNKRDFVLIQYFVFEKALRPLSYFEVNSSEF